MANGQEWNIKRLLEWTTDYFVKNEVESARLCAEILLADALGCQRIELYTRFDQCPPEDVLAKFRSTVKRGGNHEPIAYLVGYKEFFSLRFIVDEGVLIPRPETELLVSNAIDFLTAQTSRPTLQCLDLCCGSGCIGITIASNVVETEVTISDISDEALAIAEKNIEKHELSERVKLCKSDLFEDLDGGYDLIISNPPYISDIEFAKVAKNVADFEPHLALKAADDGLEFYKKILEKADNYLADDGAIMVEIGYEQGQTVSELFQNCGYLTDIKVVKDLQGHDRVVKGVKKF